MNKFTAEELEAAREPFDLGAYDTDVWGIVAALLEARAERDEAKKLVTYWQARAEKYRDEHDAAIERQDEHAERIAAAAVHWKDIELRKAEAERDEWKTKYNDLLGGGDERYYRATLKDRIEQLNYTQERRDVAERQNKTLGEAVDKLAGCVTELLKEKELWTTNLGPSSIDNKEDAEERNQEDEEVRG